MSNVDRMRGLGPHAVIIAVVGALWVAGVVLATGGLPDNLGPGFCVQLVVAWGVIAGVWQVALRIVRRGGSVRKREENQAQDAPLWVLRQAVGTMSESRRSWGYAMMAELGHVQGTRARWEFAVGCAVAAIGSSGVDRGGLRLSGLVSAGALIAAGIALGHEQPSLQQFAGIYVVVFGLLCVVPRGRAGRGQEVTRSYVVAAAGLVGVIACIGATSYFLVVHPIAMTYFSPTVAVLLGTAMACSSWLVIRPPRRLLSHSQPQWIAVVTAGVLAAGVMLASRLGLRGAFLLEEGLFGYLVLCPILLIFVSAGVSAAIGRSLVAGLQATVWTALLGTLAAYSIGLVEALEWFRLDSSLIFDREGVTIEGVGENIRGFAWGLVLLPFLWIPFGVLGAELGRRARLAFA